MESIHNEAARFGIEQPELEYQQREEESVTVVSLTEQSEREWSNYLRAINMAKLAMRDVV